MILAPENTHVPFAVRVDDVWARLYVLPLSPASVPRARHCRRKKKRTTRCALLPPTTLKRFLVVVPPPPSGRGRGLSRSRPRRGKSQFVLGGGVGGILTGEASTTGEMSIQKKRGGPSARIHVRPMSISRCCRPSLVPILSQIPSPLVSRPRNEQSAAVGVAARLRYCRRLAAAVADRRTSVHLPPTSATQRRVLVSSREDDDDDDGGAAITPCAFVRPRSAGTPFQVIRRRRQRKRSPSN